MNDKAKEMEQGLTELYERVKAMRDVLNSCAEYFDKRADYDQPPGELPQPNKEMQLLVEIDQVLK